MLTISVRQSKENCYHQFQSRDDIYRMNSDHSSYLPIKLIILKKYTGTKSQTMTNAPDEIIFEIALKTDNDEELEKLINSSGKYRKLFNSPTLQTNYFWERLTQKRYHDEIYQKLKSTGIKDWHDVYYSLNDSDIYDQYLYIDISINRVRTRFKQPASFDAIYKQIILHGSGIFMLTFGGDLYMIYGYRDVNSPDINLSDYSIEKYIKLESVTPPFSFVNYYNENASDQFKRNPKCAKISAIDDQIISIKTIESYDRARIDIPLMGIYLTTKKGNVIFFYPSGNFKTDLTVLAKNNNALVLTYSSPIENIIISEYLLIMFMSGDGMYASGKDGKISKLATIPSFYDHRKIKLYSKGDVLVFTYNNVIFSYKDGAGVLNYHQLKFNMLNVLNIDISAREFKIVDDKFKIYDVYIQTDNTITYENGDYYMALPPNGIAITVIENGKLDKFENNISRAPTIYLTNSNIDKVIGISMHELTLSHVNVMSHMILTVKRYGK